MLPHYLFIYLCWELNLRLHSCTLVKCSTAELYSQPLCGCCSTWLQYIFSPKLCFYIINHCIDFDLGHTTLEQWGFVVWGYCLCCVSKSGLVSMVINFYFITAIVHYCVLLALFPQLLLKITHFLPSPSMLPWSNRHHLIQTLPERISWSPASTLAYIQSVLYTGANKLFCSSSNHKSVDVSPEF